MEARRKRRAARNRTTGASTVEAAAKTKATITTIKSARLTLRAGGWRVRGRSPRDPAVRPPAHIEQVLKPKRIEAEGYLDEEQARDGKGDEEHFLLPARRVRGWQEGPQPEVAPRAGVGAALAHLGVLYALHGDGKDEERRIARDEERNRPPDGWGAQDGPKLASGRGSRVSRGTRRGDDGEEIPTFALRRRCCAPGTIALPPSSKAEKRA